MTSIKRFFFVGVLCLLTYGCSTPAIIRIQQKKWSAAESSLRKSLKKDTLNTESKFVYAQYYLSEGNPDFDVDSSYAWTQKALTAWQQSSEKQRERLQKIEIDSLAIVDFRSRVDSAAFERARVANTQQAYEHFIERFPSASGVPKAIELRDELAYVEALRVNTPAAFKKYVIDFPSSRRVEDAANRYEQLIFQERTRAGNIDSYKSFLAEFPNSAHREEAERFVFEVSTSSGLIDDYLNFIKGSPTSSQIHKARNIIYYLMRESGMARPALIDNDSLRLLDERNEGYWVPFYKNGLYGFMNDDGIEVIEPQYEAIDSAYLCGEITGDFVVTSTGVYSRSGALLVNKTPTRAIDMGHGFLGIVDGNCQTIVHQSGFRVSDECVSDARILADQFLSIKRKDGWHLYALNGRQLTTSPYEGVSNVDKLITLKRYNKYIVVQAKQVASIPYHKPLNESLVFDEVRAWGEGNLWVKNGVLEGVIDQDLQFIIPLGRQVLVKTSFGFTSRKDGKIHVTGVPALEGAAYDNVRDYGDWLELRTGKASTLYKVSQKKVVAEKLDSIWMKNRVVFGVRNDSLNVYTGSSKLASFERLSPVNFIPGSDTLVYFWVPEKKNRVVFEASQGKKLFSGDFEDIEVINSDLFIFSKKNKKGAMKKGIFRRDGKIAQPAEYDAIIPTGSGYLSLLKEKKFGLYDIKKQKLIKPVYERNVLPYAGNYFIAYKGAYGIITAAEEPVTGFEFDEVKYWNDTAAWVKKNYAWSIVSIRNKEYKLSRIRSFQTIKDTPAERIVRVQQDNYFGIVSSRKGVVIPPTFTEIINIGSSDKPFYFTEKRVEEAGIYVVIYYNSLGKLVRKQVYEEEEYGKIYCEN